MNISDSLNALVTVMALAVARDLLDPVSLVAVGDTGGWVLPFST